MTDNNSNQYGWDMGWGVSWWVNVFSARHVALNGWYSHYEVADATRGFTRVKVYIFVYTYISVCTVCTYIHSVLSCSS